MANVRARASMPRHGGDLAFATAVYGEPDNGWLDLSTGINPDPYPLPAAPPQIVTRLPARDSLDRLLGTARSAYAVPAGASLVATPGSEIGLRLLPLVAPPGTVAVVAPTYASHREAWTNAGRAVVTVASLDAVPDDAVIVAIANPNNPDGRLVGVDRLVDAALALGERAGLLVVDEAFGELAPEASIIPRLAGLPAVALRSLGKFYGLAGFRLGFAAGPPERLARLAALLGDWPVSGPAIAAGTTALADTAWRQAARLHLHAQAQRLRTLLLGHGLTVAGSTDLFVLVTHPDAADLHRRLAEHGVWTRIFADEPAWLRIGLPSGEAGLARLAAALPVLTAPPARSTTTAPRPAPRERKRSRR